MKATYLGSTAIYEGKKRKKTPMFDTVAIKGRKYPVVYMIASLNEKKYFLFNLKRKPTKAEIAIDDKAPNSRIWGWVPTFKEADEAVKCNSGDMAECCYYTHTVIERVMCGIPNFNNIDDSNETWYKWHVDPKDPHKFKGKWKRCPKPDWSKGIAGWTVS